MEADRNQMSSLNGKKLSGTYSNTFGDKVGVLLGVVYAKRDVRTDTAGNESLLAVDPQRPSRRLAAEQIGQPARARCGLIQ